MKKHGLYGPYNLTRTLGKGSVLGKKKVLENIIEQKKRLEDVEDPNGNRREERRSRWTNSTAASSGCYSLKTQNNSITVDVDQLGKMMKDIIEAAIKRNLKTQVKETMQEEIPKMVNITNRRIQYFKTFILFYFEK
jgi:chemotaxis protein histidine kinase CheA